MREIEFPASAGGGATKMSVLGFGCAALMGRASRRESLTALGAAMDAGINFFDTARSYGYGASEGLLGGFLEGRREQVVVCTKFGILPAARNWKQMARPVVRAAIRLVPSLRQAAQRQAGSQFLEGQFTLANLKTSFETSLRQLRTEYVDMLLLHAAPASVLEQDDLLEAMGRLVEQGKVRMAGISGELPVISSALGAKYAALSTAQFAVNFSNMGEAVKVAAAGEWLMVANHPFGGPAGVEATRARIAGLAVAEGLGKELREKLAVEDAQLLPEVVLNAILSGTGVSAVVPAMIKPGHIAANVRAVEACRFTAEELVVIRGVVAKG